MQRKPSSCILAVGFLALSATISVALLATRNLYDDEISSFGYITLPFTRIVHALAHGDVHPPGMYLLAHLAYCILPSFRWLNLFPLIFFYAGLSFFVLSITPVFLRTRAQICFLLLATLHPQLLMWSNTFRWYSWWTSLALIVLIVALQPRHPRPTLTIPRALGIGLLLACLFYLNYITLLFAAALAIAIFFRHRAQPRKQLAICALLTVLVFAVLIAPQIHTMVTVHLPNSGGQRSSILVSLAQLLFALTASDAFLPWHPLALLTVLVFSAIAVAAVTATPVRNGEDQAASTLVAGSRSGIVSILIFGALFFMFVVLSGLGGKPRSALLLTPVFALVMANAVRVLRPRLQVAILFFFAIWSATGVAHELGRYGLIKATMNDRPEQVVAFIRHTDTGDCPLVVTYDTGLSFAFSQSRLPGLILLSGTGEPIYLSGPPQPASRCARIRLYAVRSYLGGTDAWTEELIRELNASTRFIQGHAQTDAFSLDPDAPMKRRLAHLPATNNDLAGAAQLPEYRFVVVSGLIDASSPQAMLQAMPDFVSGSSPGAK